MFKYNLWFCQNSVTRTGLIAKALMPQTTVLKIFCLLFIAKKVINGVFDKVTQQPLNLFTVYVTAKERTVPTAVPPVNLSAQHPDPTDTAHAHAVRL